jgi:hypothetical protein
MISSPPAPLHIVLFKSGVEPPGGPYNLTGRVTLSDNPDASGVTVVAVEKPSGVTQDSTTTTQSGIYRLFVPPSEYIVRASKPGYQTEEKSVTVPPGGQVVTGVDFTLSRSGTSSAVRKKRQTRTR